MFRLSRAALRNARRKESEQRIIFMLLLFLFYANRFVVSRARILAFNFTCTPHTAVSFEESFVWRRLNLLLHAMCNASLIITRCSVSSHRLPSSKLLFFISLNAHIVARQCKKDGSSENAKLFYSRHCIERKVCFTFTSNWGRIDLSLRNANWIGFSPWKKSSEQLDRQWCDRTSNRCTSFARDSISFLSAFRSSQLLLELCINELIRLSQSPMNSTNFEFIGIGYNHPIALYRCCFRITYKHMWQTCTSGKHLNWIYFMVIWCYRCCCWNSPHAQRFDVQIDCIAFSENAE